MNRQKYIKYLFFSFFLFFAFNINAQITILPPNVGFTQACASPSFNTYNFSFSFFPVQNLQPGNQFIVELSDNQGNFDNPVTVKVLTNTTSPVSSNFPLPTNAYGEAYRIRIRSTNPVKISNPSNPFAAYYAVHNQPFSINNNVGTVNLCQGESYTLQIDNNASSPLAYPQLQYIWYKDFVEIPGETGPSLTVNQSGSYYVIVDYGSCVLNSYSNIIQVQLLPNLNPVITAAENSDVICPGGTKTLTSSIQNSAYAYTWYKNDILISGASSPTYNATEEGVYHLSVSNGACAFESNALSLEVTDIELDIDPDVETVILPGETVPLTAITDAQNPTFQWSRNNTAISGATLAGYNATLAGTYKVVVTQSTPCAIVKQKEVTLVYPSSFNFVIQTAAGYTACNSTTAQLQVSQLQAVTPQGPVNLISNPYGYTYQWFRNNVAVTGATAAQLTVNNASQNGSYTLKITIPDYGTITSNAVPVNLPLGDVNINGPSTLCEGGNVILTSDVNNSNFTYQWFKNNAAVTGANTTSYTATAEGTYYVIVTSGSCTKQSNSITLDIPEIAVNSTAPQTSVIIPGNSVTIPVTTDAQSPTYKWYRNNVLLAETSSTLTATQDGTYKVIVTQTAGCNVTAERTFILQYPSAFNVAITQSAGYQPCVSTSSTLNINTFTATTPQGNINVITMGYPYQWYRNNTAVPGATTASLTLNSPIQNGQYKLGVNIPEIGLVFSNIINVQLPLSDVTINAASALCQGGSVVLTADAVSNNYTYQWYKNNTLVTGATQSTYTANAEGNYYVIVSAGSCNRQSNTIALAIAQITANTIAAPVDVILPGQTKTLTVSTNAQGPTYTWYRNNVLLSESSNSLQASQEGTYKVVITQTIGCNATTEQVFELHYPTAFSLTIQNITGYQPCLSTSTTLNASTFTASTFQGNVDVSALGYPYQWYRDNQPLAGETSATLTINSATQNGSYKLGVTIPGFSVVFSNTITIQLAIDNVVISSNSVLCEGTTVVLSSNINSAQYTYQWFKNNTLISGATQSSYTAATEGNYHLTVTSGTCTKQSDTIALTVAQISVASTAPENDVILPGETKTFTVTTNAQSPVFTWYRNNVQLSETSATLTATEEGQYKVVVTQTAGCTATAEKSFNLEYPSAFAVNISAPAEYEACVSTGTTLNISAFTATTTQGTITVTGMAYPVQWYKNDLPVAGGTTTTFSINDAAGNGVYKLGINIPGFGTVFSNTISVQLKIEDLTISANTVLCQGSDVLLSSTLTNNLYSYQWYKNNVAITGANAVTFTANAAGDYYLIVTSGTCSRQSNTVALSIAQIAINSAAPQTDVILPGQTKTIIVTTNAQAPVYAWYRNNILLAETSATLSATEDGEYKVVVTQTAGCTATAEKIFTLQYPTGFNLIIAPAAGYTACVSASTTLSATSFTASTLNGNINVTALGYPLQWYKDNDPVPGALSSSLTVANASQNGIYKLGVTVPGFGIVFSNTLTVNLAIEPVQIVASGQLCTQNPAVGITNNIASPAYTYTWYKDGAEVSTTGPGFTANQEGEYYVVVNTGECTFTSNTVTITTNSFNLTAVTPATDFIIPGETKDITVATDAQQPLYEWYRNNVLITGADGSTLTATQDGEYKVVVTQTNGCNISNELIFTLAYPSAFEAQIATAAGYQACTSLNTTLSLTSLKAITPGGAVTIAGSSYIYQWYKGTMPIPGANATTLNVIESAQYSLQITIPNWGVVTSNSVDIQLGFANNLTIVSEGSFCSDDATIILTGSLTNPLYTYRWFKNGSSNVIGFQPTLTVNETGDYHLEVSYQDCTLTSNTLELAPADLSQIIIDIDAVIELPEGTSTTLGASGAETYSWYKNGTLFSVSSSVEITEAGSYSITATIGECEVTKNFTVQIVENTVIAIPNIVTPNNDGINDKWVLPREYVHEDIEIRIYAPNGKVEFRSYSYAGNWPEADFTWSLKNPVYYYTITKNEEIIKRGSITILK